MMYCCESVSSMEVRTRRTFVAVRMIAMVSAGMTKLSGPSMPLGGSRPSVMENSSTIMMASQKFGNDRPTSDRMRMT